MAVLKRSLAAMIKFPKWIDRGYAGLRLRRHDLRGRRRSEIWSRLYSELFADQRFWFDHHNRIQRHRPDQRFERYRNSWRQRQRNFDRRFELVTCGGSGDVINLNNSSGTWDLCHRLGRYDLSQQFVRRCRWWRRYDCPFRHWQRRLALQYVCQLGQRRLFEQRSLFQQCARLIGGGGNNVYLSGSGDAIYLYNTSGSWDNVSGSNSTISVASSQANVNGSSDNISLSGTGDAVSLANTAGTWDYVTGSGSTVNVNSSYGAVGGGGDTIGVSGAGSVVYLYNTSGNWDTVNGSSSTIYVSGSQRP